MATKEDINARARARYTRKLDSERARKREDTKRRYGKDQDAGRARGRAYYKQNRDKCLANAKKWREANKEHVQALREAIPTEILMCRSAQQRAKKSGVPFNIVATDIVIPDVCPVLGIPMRRERGSLSPNSPTLDRFIPALGYVPGNITVISHRANTIKNDASVEELIKVAEWAQRRIL